MENPEPELVVNVEGDPVVDKEVVTEVKCDNVISEDVKIVDVSQEEEVKQDETIIKRVLSQNAILEVSEFVTSLSSILEDKTLLEKYSVKLSAHHCDILKKLLVSHTLILEGLKMSIEKSVEDNKIDVAEFLQLFQEFYKTYYTSGFRGVKGESKAAICAVIFKFLIEYVHKMDEEGLPKLLETTDKIIGLGVAMIDAKKSLKKNKWFFCLF